MARIIAARVETQDSGETIVEALRKQQFDETQIFFVSQPGQHAAHPLGEDMEADPRMKRARDAEDEREATQREDPGPEALDTRRGGLMVAVNLGDVDEAPVVELLKRWRNGDWVNFDSVAPPKLVEPERKKR